MKSGCSSSFIQARCGFCFFWGVSRDEPPHPVPQAVGRGHCCPRFLGPEDPPAGGTGVARPHSGAQTEPCSREHAGVLILHPRALCTITSPPVSPGGGPAGFGHGKKREPIPEAGKQWVRMGGMLKEEPRGGTVGAECAFGPDPVLPRLSGARNFWRDLTLGTFCSQHRWVTLPTRAIKWGSRQ